MQKPSYSSILKNILFSALTLLFVFLSIEFSCQAFYRIKFSREQFYVHWFQWAKIMGWHPPREGVINAFGFHNSEMNPLKEKNEFRILVLGSSAVYGTDDIHSSWTWNLENLLNQTSEKVHFQVLNGGVSGGTSHEDVKHLRDTLEFDPDLVIIYNGFNDTYAMHYSPEAYLDRQPEYGTEGDMDELRQFLYRRSLALTLLNQWTCEVKARRKAKKISKISQQKIEKENPQPFLSESKPKKIDRADLKQKVLNIWGVDYVYKFDENSAISEDGISYYEKNLGEIHRILARRKISHVIILQPNLAYSMASGQGSEGAKGILKNTTGVLYNDWIKASGVLYPACIKVINRLREKGILAYDFTGIFQRIEEEAFGDSVHQKDGYPKDRIAEKVKEVLLENNLLPKA